MALYYPDQAMILPMTTIRRERLLPPDALGEVPVNEGDRVDAYTIVARGVSPTRYLFVDLMKPLGARDPEEVVERLLIQPGSPVETGQVLAGEPSKKRGPQVTAPASGIATMVVNGRLVLETELVEHEIRAGFNAVVASVRGDRGVLLEANGALLQGAWGNGQSHFGLLKAEPDGGLAALEEDQFSTQWRGVIVFTTSPLNVLHLQRANAAGIGGLIAPGMRANLREMALGLKMPVMLTEGFGAAKINALAQGLLGTCTGRQVYLEARSPQRWQEGRPEMIAPMAGERAAPPMRSEPLRVGAEARITREPFAGMIVRVKSLPGGEQIIENGLRLPVAEVQLPSGRVARIPLANLELFGRG